MSPNRKRSPARNTAISRQNHQSETVPLFHTWTEAGDYDAIIGRKLRRILREAAQDTGLELEIGVLRLTLIRLLLEEPDPSRLATGVARVVGVAVQAARLRHNPDSELDEIRRIMLRELEAIDAEDARRQEQHAVHRRPTSHIDC